MITKTVKRAFSSVGSLWTWGETTYGWGRTVNNQLRVPGRVQGFDDVTAVATGPFHMLLSTSTHEVFSVGYGKNGRLGNGSTNNLESPESISELAGLHIKQLAAGGSHSLALTQTGDVFSWGYGGGAGIFNFIPFLKGSSPLGHGQTDDLSSPRLIEGLSEPVSHVAAGENVSIAVGKSGKVYGWGALALINKTGSSVPIEMDEINFFLHKHHAHVVKIASTGVNCFFLLDNGKIYVIGKNNGGVFATRTNPRVVEDDLLFNMTKVVDDDFKNERIVDFKVSGNSLIFITDAGSIFYSGMHTTFRPERFPVTGSVKSIFATYDSVGVIHQNGKITFLNDAFIHDSLKKDNIITSLDPSLTNAFEIGGSYCLRYALVRQ